MLTRVCLPANLSEKTRRIDLKIIFIFVLIMYIFRELSTTLRNLKQQITTKFYCCLITGDQANIPKSTQMFADINCRSRQARQFN